MARQRKKKSAAPEGASYWAKEQGFTVVTVPFLPEENEEVKLATILAGHKSKAEFIRTVIVERARQILAENKIKRK